MRQVDDVRIVVQEGVSFVYADGGDRELYEDAPLDLAPTLVSSVAAHEAVAELTTTGRTAVRLRIGLLVGDDVMTAFRLAGARRGAPLILGDRDACTCAVDHEDAANGAVAALRAPSGIYNIGAPPVRKQVVGEAMAVAAGVKRPRRLPGFLARRNAMLALLARSQRVVSNRLTDATGWRAERPTPGPSWFEH